MIFSPISKENPLILASSSPRRKTLLEQIGLPFRILPSHVEEEGLTGESSMITKLFAEKKARTVHRQSPNAWVLGADTIVVLGASRLGKPADREEARSMLLRLSGKEHEVVTGFSLLDPSGKNVHTQAVSTRVGMKALTEEEIRSYIATGEPFGKAGGYAVQGIGAFMVESISGSYTNVVGLPVCALVKALRAVGALRNFPLEG
ncbi:MAG: septum formation protein Maf [Proteobacteria bacterium]|nr:septum formation protein Maf [Pseudomonadota bacterium]